MFEHESTREVARALLHTATPATDRALVAWAVGAMHADHCLYMAQYRRTGDPTVMGAQCTGGASRELDYDLDGKGFTGLVKATGHRIQLRWRQVGDVLDRSVRLSDLVDEQRDLLQRRVELIGQADDLFREWQRTGKTAPEQDEHNRQWSWIERRCAEAARRTWKACYPSQQLDLFGGSDADYPF